MIESFENRMALDEVAANRDFPEGYSVYIEDEKKTLTYRSGEWVEEEIKAKTNSNVEMSLYEINRQLVTQLPNFEDTQWSGAKAVFTDWYKNLGNTYFLLYGQECHYFTLFMKSPDTEENLFDVLKECLINVGPVKAFDITENKDAVEIWVEVDGIATCFYLFNYDDGVVKFNA